MKNEDSDGTELSKLIDELDTYFGYVLGFCEEGTHIELEDWMGNALEIYNQILLKRFEIGTNFYETP